MKINFATPQFKTHFKSQKEPLAYGDEISLKNREEIRKYQ